MDLFVLCLFACSPSTYMLWVSRVSKCMLLLQSEVKKKSTHHMLLNSIDEFNNCKHPFELTNRTFVSPSL
jgi:hypothetical protein